MLGWGEARAFEEVDHGYRQVAEFFTGPAGDFQILALVLRVASQMRLAVTLHEGVIQRPEGQTDKGYPDQLLLQEELEVGRLAIEGLHQRRDIHPGLVVADHQVGVIVVQRCIAADIPAGRQHQTEDRLVDLRPAFGDPHYPARAPAAEAFVGNHHLEHREHQHGADADQGVEQNEQAGEDAGQPVGHGFFLAWPVQRRQA